MNEKPTRDIEREYSNAEFVAKLRRLADCIEVEVESGRPSVTFANRPRPTRNGRRPTPKGKRQS
jgi:hypothetical protein